jgi:hypothetical protein
MRNLHFSHIHRVVRGTGTPKNKDEVYRRVVCQCEGWVCVHEVIVVPSRLRLTRKAEVLVRILSTFSLGCEENTVRRKWKSPLVDCGRWTPEVVQKRSVYPWSRKNKSLTNSLCNLPDVLAIVGINEMTFGGLFKYFSQIYTFGSY